MDTCLFCRMIRHEVPAHIIEETDLVFVILDIYPVHTGHLLVIPKEHAAVLPEASSQALEACMRTVQRYTALLPQAIPCDGVNVLQNNGPAAGQVIPHVHFHVIPRFADDGLRHWPSQAATERDLLQMADHLRGAAH